MEIVQGGVGSGEKGRQIRLRKLLKKWLDPLTTQETEAEGSQVRVQL